MQYAHGHRRLHLPSPAPSCRHSAVATGRKELAISRDDAATCEWKERKKAKFHYWKHCWQILLIFQQMTPCQCLSEVLQSACHGSASGTATQNNECCLPPLSGWFVSTSLTFQYFYIWFLWDESHHLLISTTVRGLFSILEIFQPIVILYATEFYNHNFIFCSGCAHELSFSEVQRGLSLPETQWQNLFQRPKPILAF